MTTELAPIERAKQVLSFDETKAKLADLAVQSVRIVEITTPAGYQEAQRARVELKATRVDIQKRGKAAREDATAYSKAVIEAEKELIGVIEPEESRLQALQDAWDAEREAERQAKIRAEQERVDIIQKRIANIRTAPAFCVSQTSEELRASLFDIKSIVIGDDFAEFVKTAEAAKAEAIANMEAMITAAEQRESAEAQRAAESAAKAESDRIEAERMAAERAELERQRAELESQRQAAAKAQADAEAAQRAAQEAQRKSEDDARRAEIERQREAERVARDAAEAQAKAALEAAAAAEAARIAAEIANATLRDAAEEALGLLVDLGEGEHITARKLAAAIARDGSKVQS